MSAGTAQPGSSEPAKNKNAKSDGKTNGKTELKILMLHGYTQSGPLFRTKTGALSKLLTKGLSAPPYNLQPTLIYPTGPHRLRPSDIPGYTAPEGQDANPDEETDNWSWFRRDEATNVYRGFEEGMRSLAGTIAEHGGVDGVLGFSQGGATAALVAAALEPSRAVPGSPAPPEEGSWAQALRDANGGRPLKFAVVYSGFVATDQDLQWLYDGGLSTPSLHFIGGLDTVVDESRSRALVEKWQEGTARVVVHPGGHYVPVSKEWSGALVGFLRDVLLEKTGEENADLGKL